MFGGAWKRALRTQNCGRASSKTFTFRHTFHISSLRFRRFTTNSGRPRGRRTSLTRPYTERTTKLSTITVNCTHFTSICFPPWPARKWWCSDRFLTTSCRVWNWQLSRELENEASKRARRCWTVSDVGCAEEPAMYGYNHQDLTSGTLNLAQAAQDCKHNQRRKESRLVFVLDRQVSR